MLPKIDPILPVLSRTVPLGREWLYGAELDGFRGVLSIENGRGSFLSKSKRPMPRFKELADLLARSMRVDDAIDGEIVVMTDTGPYFHALFAARGEPAYAAFDLLWHNGTDLRPLPFHRRRHCCARSRGRGRSRTWKRSATPPCSTPRCGWTSKGSWRSDAVDAYAADTQWVKVKHGGLHAERGEGGAVPVDATVMT